MGGGTSTPKSEEVQKESLSEYFEYLYTETLCFKRSTAEIDDITKAVIELVANKILVEVGIMDERFKHQSILFVGSMCEGTCNGEPKEFDFLVILKNLPSSEDTELSLGCKDGYVHIGIKETACNDFQKEWESMIVDNKIKSTNSRWSFRSTFRYVLGNAVNAAKYKDHKISKPTGELEIYSSSVERHGPASLCTLKWKSHDSNSGCPRQLIISVDITPAIQFPNVGEVISCEEVGNEALYQHLMDKKSYMLIPCKNDKCYGFCFKLTFTNTELALMHKLSNHHRKCYRIVKYLFNGITPKNIDNIIFHSYSLKTFVLRHDLENSCDEYGSGHLAKCVSRIIDDIDKCLTTSKKYFYTFEMCLPSILLPAHNIYDRLLNKPLSAINAKGMTKMRASLDTIANADLPCDLQDRLKKFEQFKVKLVNWYVPNDSPPNLVGIRFY